MVKSILIQEKTKENTGIQINLAFNYSAREEIIQGLNQIIANKKNVTPTRPIKLYT